MSRSTCDGSDGNKCRRPKKIIDHKDLYLPPADNVNDSIKKVFEERRELCEFCSDVCKDKTNMPQRLLEKPQMKDFKNPPPFLAFNNLHSKFTAKQLSEAQDDVLINGHVYSKKMIVVHDNAPPHFNTIFQRRQEWINYDGMKVPRFRYTNDRDLQNDHQKFKAESLTYFHKGPAETWDNWH